MSAPKWIAALEAAGANLTDSGHHTVGRNPAVLKQVCAYCGRLIRDGALTAEGKASHGLCDPVCDEGKKYGWGDA